VFNNEGYLSIRLSQKNLFGRLTGEGPQTGVSFPDVVKVAQAYGLPALQIRYDEMESGICTVLDQPGPVVCDVLLDPDQPFEPRISSKQLSDGRIVSSNLEDMFPFLDPQELATNMLVPYDKS
jgi:acetolactate synthase-1/2/3 large subunit